MPVPVLLRAPEPLTTPLSVSCVPLTLSVLSAASATVPLRLAVPALLVRLPPLRVTGSAPTTIPLRSSVPPLATVVPAAVLPRPAALPSLSVPPVMLLAPV